MKFLRILEMTTCVCGGRQRHNQMWISLNHRVSFKLTSLLEQISSLATNAWTSVSTNSKVRFREGFFLFYKKRCAPNVGLEPTTLRLRVSCSTDWASRAAGEPGGSVGWSHSLSVWRWLKFGLDLFSGNCHHIYGMFKHHGTCMNVVLLLLLHLDLRLVAEVLAFKGTLVCSNLALMKGYSALLIS